MAFPIETIHLLDELIATPEGQALIQQRWQHAKESAIAKAAADRKAAEAAREAAPGPLTGWDCWVCGWADDAPRRTIGGCQCPSCYCVHGLRAAPGAWMPHR